MFAKNAFSSAHVAISFIMATLLLISAATAVWIFLNILENTSPSISGTEKSIDTNKTILLKILS